MAKIIGTKNNDKLVGTNKADEIFGQAGSDRLEGNNGNDALYGGAGNDTLIGGVGNDKLFDSVGNNVLDGGTGNDTLNINNSTGNNRLSGGAGNDSFYAYKVQGTNIFNGENGNDSFYLSASITAPASLKTQTVDGGKNYDYLSINYSQATEKITSNFDTYANKGLITSGNNQVSYKNIEKLNIIGTAYDDYIVGSSGKNQIAGGAGSDYLNVDYSTSDNILKGDSGDDNLSADATTGDNLLDGGAGNDNISASGYHTFYDGTTNAASGNNTLIGGAGDDSLNAKYTIGDNLLDGGDGNDHLFIGSYADQYGFATSGNNTLNGGAGDDELLAAFITGDNLLDGGDGNDNINVSSYYDYSGNNAAGFGNNTVYGGIGNDSISFVFYTSPDSLKTQKVDGGVGEDILKVLYAYPTEGIISTFDTATNQGSITAGNNLINYKNIEKLEISGTAYNDQMIGGSGNDSFDGGSDGIDTIDGGAGEDSFSFYNYQATEGITSTFDAATNQGFIKTGTYQVSYKNIERLAISGTRHDDLMIGGNGNDSFDGGIDTDGNDTIDGGAGEDLLSFLNYSGSQGITTTFDVTTKQGSIIAGTYLANYKNIERLDIRGTNYDDKIVGTDGNDTLQGGGEGNDQISGGAGDDNLVANYSQGNNFLDGGSGNDDLSASGEVSEYRGEVSIYAVSGNNTLKGGTGDDKLIANYSSGNNILEGGDGNDFLSVSGNDFFTYYGLYSATGNNTLKGGAGDDKLIVDYSSGNNILEGGDGNDDLSAFGASGKNTLNGGNGNDILTGGNGTDTFVFNSYNQGVDLIKNFNATNDRIQISSAGFGGLSKGTLSANQFIVGTSATNSDQRFIYNLSTGGLYFDQDGSAAGFSQVQFATLSSGLTLTNNNFVVV
jgi:Ca2+-binding RTX toxin-like protein